MRPLLFACLAIALASVYAPKLIAQYVPAVRDGMQRSAPASTRASAEAAEAPREVRHGSRQVDIRAERDGHFYVDADVNFRPVRLMVDTGATVVALRRSDAEAAGIRLSPADFDRPVSTANGNVMAAEAEIDSLSVRDIEVRGLRVLVLPDEQLSISLLGASFLNRLARFEVRNGTLSLEN